MNELLEPESAAAKGLEGELPVQVDGPRLASDIQEGKLSLPMHNLALEPSAEAPAPADRWVDFSSFRQANTPAWRCPGPAKQTHENPNMEKQTSACVCWDKINATIILYT